MEGPKVILVIAFNGFQQIEYNIPKEILKNAGFNVITASDKMGAAIAKDGSSADVDVLITKIKLDEYEGIFFIGGPGALEHLDNEHSYAILKKAHATNTPFGAICISTRILAKAGVLRGKIATGWNGDGELDSLYQDCGVDYAREEKVVVSDGVVTATGPHAAKEFGEEIIGVLQNKQGWG